MLRVAVFALIALPVAAQTAPSVAEILRNVSTTFKDAKDYELVVEHSERGMKMKTQIAFQSPDRMRLEMTRVDLVPPVVASRAVVDASGVWTYLGETNTYGFQSRGDFRSGELESLVPQDRLAFFRDMEK